MKKILSYLYLAVFLFDIHGQCNLKNDVVLGTSCAATIDLGLNMPFFASNQIVTARDNIIMTAGFYVNSLNGKYFLASTDYTQTEEINDYLVGDEKIDGTTRQLNKSNFAPGTIGGTIDVSPSGAATYNIPIMVSPGSHGMQPSLGIVYSSQSGNDILGYGWHLSGLSMINRVNKNYYYDGNYATPTIADGLSMDGQRLICTNPNTYTYAPENNPYVVVTTDASWTSFTVKTQDGVVMNYNIQFLPKDGTVTYAWAMSKITDAEGNYIQFNYLRNNTTGEYRISDIQYTGNSNTGIAPYNKILFKYDKRSDINTSYFAGKEVNQTMLLSSIEVIAEGTMAYDYSFSYSNDSYYSKLNQVALVANGIAYNPTIINWGEVSDYEVAPLTNLGSEKLYEFYLYPGDFNGDGLTDIAKWSFINHTIDVKFALLGGGWSTDVPQIVITNGNIMNEKSITVIDWNNDGQDEIIVGYYQIIDLGTGNYDQYDFVKCYSYTGNGFNISILKEYSPITRSNNEYIREYDHCYGDFNNDGTCDIITTIGYKYYSISCSSIIGNPDIYSIYEMRVLDFDGDGQIELLTLGEEGTGYIWKYDNTINTFKHVYGNGNTFFGLTKNLFLGDFNGDGKTDYLSYDLGWSIHYSTGVDFIAGTVPTGMASYDPSDVHDPSKINERASDSYLYPATTVYIDDINNDGKTDILHADGNHNGCNVYVYISKGKTFLLAKQISVSPIDDYAISKISLFALDLNSDGQKEIVFGNDDDGRRDGGAKQHELFKILSFNNRLDNNLLVSNATDGNNNTSKITYSTYHDQTSAEETYPLRIIRAPMRYASNVQIKNGSSMWANTTYTFGKGIVHLQGKGFLGFMNVNSSDDVSKNESVSTYQFSVYFNSNLYSTSLMSVVNKKNNNLVSTTTFDEPHPNSPSGNYTNKLFYPFQTSSTTTDHLKGISSTKYLTFNSSLGRVTGESVTAGSWNITTDNTYTTITGYESKLTNVLTTRKLGAETFTHNMTYNYASSPFNHRIASTVEQSKITTAYSDFDSYGNVKRCTISVTDGTAPRYTRNTFDTYGRFVTSSTDVLGYTSCANYRATDGAIITQTDIKGLTTYYNYNSGGNLLGTTISWPVNNLATTTISWDETGTSLIKTTNIVKNGNTVTSYTNAAGWKLKETSLGFNGETLTTTWNYNNDGSVNYVSPPGIETEYFTYDDYGRVLTDIGLNKNISYTYSGNTVTVTDNILGQAKTQTFDAMGNITNITATTGNTSYTYFASGKPKTIVGAGVTTSMTYDNMGNQLTLSDPNAGTTTYTYNGFGQLLTQTDAQQQTITCTYDTYGRMTGKSGTNLSESYTYSTYTSSKGQIASITRDNVTETYSYDNLGRIFSMTTSGPVIPGASNTNFVTSYTYNATTARLASTTYPSGLSVSYLYDGVGNLSQINNTTTGATIWKGESQNPSGQWTQYSLGNLLITKWGYDPTTKNLSTIKTGTSGAETSIQNLGFSFNAAGQLLSRSEGSLSEVFTYDAMDRLITARVGSGTQHTFDYQINGNINSTIFAGQYTYGNQGHPHAVTAVAGAANPTGQSSAISSTASYNIENKVTSIYYNNAPYYTDEISYGTDGNRFRSDYKQYGSRISSKVYIRNSEFGYNTSGTLTYKRTIITAPTGVCAVYQDSGSVQTFYYIHTDYLGSWLAITNSSRSLTNKYSYDAWGRPRNYSTWQVKTIDVTNPQTYMAAMQPRFDRGYTGHEMLCKYGLINMNGRMYDPYLQRVLSPDVLIQQPDNSQSFNRYSYCLNNPLRYIDPSGNTWFESAMNWVGETYLTVTGMKYYYSSIAHGKNPYLAMAGMFGIAGTTFATGGLASSLASAGLPMTFNMMFTSTFNSMAMSAFTGEGGPVTFFGFGSYNWRSGEFNTFSKNNNALENIGYGLGALGNLSDIINGIDLFTHSEDKWRNELKDIGDIHTKDLNTADLDPSTLNKNYGNYSFPGGNNPLDLTGHDWIGWKDRLTFNDIAGGLHDYKWYNFHQQAGFNALATYKTSLMADWSFVGRQFYLSTKYLTTMPIDALKGYAIGGIFGGIIVPKTIFWSF